MYKCTFVGIRLYTLKMYGENNIKLIWNFFVTFWSDLCKFTHDVMYMCCAVWQHLQYLCEMLRSVEALLNISEVSSKNKILVRQLQ
jgi:hypothetical protein